MLEKMLSIVFEEKIVHKNTGAISSTSTFLIYQTSNITNHIIFKTSQKIIRYASEKMLYDAIIQHSGKL